MSKRNKATSTTTVEAPVVASTGDNRPVVNSTQIRALRYIVSHGTASKHVLYFECSATSKHLGAATREGFGVRGGGLLAMGLIRQVPNTGGKGTVAYEATQAGIEWLARYDAAQTAIASTTKPATVVSQPMPVVEPVTDPKPAKGKRSARKQARNAKRDASM